MKESNIEPELTSGHSQIVVFTLFNNDREEKYGVEVTQIKEIIQVSNITPVPNSPNFLKGIMNLRGKIIPVIDTKTKLGLRSDMGGNNHLAIIGEIGENLIGFLVDKVDQVTKTTIDDIEKETVDIVKSAYIKGIAKKPNDFVVVLDLEKIFNETEILSLDEQSEGDLN